MENFKAKFVKITSNHDYLRTDEIDGYFFIKPMVDSRFSFYGESLDLDIEGSTRFIHTSPVNSVDVNASYIEFKTLNSTYRLELMDNVFTEDQCDRLNKYQQLGEFHPYTCGKDSLHSALVATKAGWLCLDCNYTQSWAHGIQ